MTTAFLMVLCGFAMLAAGGEALVKGAVGLAEKLQIPPLVIGLTLVALGTSAPELMVSVQAGLSGNPGIAVGNIVGSNIANILLVLGATAVITPLVTDQKSLFRDGAFMMLVSCVFLLFCFFGLITRAMAIFLLMALTLYLSGVYRQEKQSGGKDRDVGDAGQTGVFLAMLLLGAGVVMVVWGADILVEGSVVLARGVGVSEAVIGLSLVALGTSLPELAISVLAAYRGEVGVAIGNIIGSNIFNICLILGVAGLITPLEIAVEIAGFDVWVMLAASFAVFAAVLARQPVGRMVGGVFLAAYVSYIAFIFLP
ncbi:MAG: calcium/sodium antiporter [Parvibaculales bacterium]